MRIGFLLPSIYMYDQFGKNRIFAPGVIGRQLADKLTDNGHEVYFYTAPGTKTKANLITGDENLLINDLSYFLFRNRSEEERLYTTTEVKKRDYEYALTLKIYQDALRGKLDIIHSYHDFGAHYFHELTNFPTIYTLHDPMPDKDTVEYFRLKRFSHHPYVSISNSQRNNFPIRFASTVYHGIDLENYIFGEGDNGYLIHFGRILEDKGTHIAIDVAKKNKIPLRIASSSVRANMSQSYYEELVKPQIDGENVLEVGFLNGREKSEYIGRAMAFVLPLQWEEPFGLVMIEAMACGTPVIAFARGSVPEIVKDGETGFIINPSDSDIRGDWVIKKTGVDGLIEAVKKVTSMTREEYQRMRHACRAHIEKNFTVEKMVEGYERVYQKVLEKHGG